MKLSAPTLKTGVPCSACGAMVVVSPTLRWTKMQCPKCRAVISLSNPRTAEASPRGELAGQTPPERAEATRLEARLSTLEARVDSLELMLRDQKALQQAPRRALGLEPVETAQGLESQTAENREPKEEEPDRGSKGKIGFEALREVIGAMPINPGETQPERRTPDPLFEEPVWIAKPDRTVYDGADTGLLPAKASGRFNEILKRLEKAKASDAAPEGLRASVAPEPVPSLEDDQLKAPPENQMLEKLSVVTPGEVAIRVKEGDAKAILFGQWLGLVFIKAGWTVAAFEARPLPPEDRNLTLLIGGSFPFPKSAAAIHSAVVAAGWELAFGIDPTSDSPVPTLIVPRRPVERSDGLEANEQRPSLDEKLTDDSPTNCAEMGNS